MAELETPHWRERSLPQLVDDIARDNPDKVYGYWPTEQPSAGFRTVTYAQLSNIVHRLSWWLVEQLGTDGRGEALTYVGPNDVRYPAIILATMKTGFRVLLTSPRNSAEAHRKLFGRLECRTLVTPDPAQGLAMAILEAVQPCRALVIPGIDELLQEAPRAYPHDKPRDESRWDSLYIVHTSGSTGIPKPIEWSQETGLRQSIASSLDPPTGLGTIETIFHGKRVLSTLPPFHGAGLYLFFSQAIPFGNSMVIPSLTGAMVTAHGVVEVLKQTPAEVAVMVPSTVAELAQNPDLLEFCAQRLELILYAGGDLPQAVGDVVAAKIPLRCWWGASEVGMPNQLISPDLPNNKEWHYLMFHPCTGAVFEPVKDGLYEMVIRRDEALVDTQTTFAIRGFEDATEYRTKDLYYPHPNVPNAWRWCGRADDIIVFLNGEKTNPVSMEQHIGATRADVIGGAIVVGNQRFQTALIIEPKNHDSALTTAEEASLIETVWPSVVEANKEAPAHARVEKALILVAKKPFIRAGKGTVQRAASVAQYEADIEKLYANADASSLLFEDGDQQDQVTNVIEAIRAIQKAVHNIAKLSSIGELSSLGEDDNFFESGMDSLQALQLVRAMRVALSRPLALSTIYQNPTPRQLAASALSTTAEISDDRALSEQILDTYRGLISQIPKTSSPLAQETAKTFDVLLTGSTGTLGTSTLHSLLRNAKVGHVFCLNRGADGGQATQNDRFAAAQLDTGLLQRVSFLQADLTDPMLGVGEEAYNMLTGRVRLVIHNAWPVNFNLALSAFRPVLAGVVHLLRFTRGIAQPGSHMVFISSVSATAGIGSEAPPETVPDEKIALSTALPNGYARSKLLAEFLCDTAAQTLDLRISIIRVGQVAGSTAPGGTIWNRAEWLPSLVISSAQKLKCLPESLGPRFQEIDWMPSDLLGSVVAEIGLADQALAHTSGAAVFNARNPRTTEWSSLVPSVQEAIKTVLDRDVPIVTPDEWLARLQESEEEGGGETATAESYESLTKNPAVKLLSFYRDGLWPREIDNAATYAPMIISQAQAASDTLRDMPAVNPDWMKKWTREWIDL